MDHLIFLTEHQQLCKLGTSLSRLVNINRSIIRGSGIVPTLHTVMKSDLTPLNTLNELIKYADDVDLLVLEQADIDLTIEFNQLKAWGAQNKMVFNFQKTSLCVYVCVPGLLCVPTCHGLCAGRLSSVEDVPSCLAAAAARVYMCVSPVFCVSPLVMACVLGSCLVSRMSPVVWQHMCICVCPQSSVCLHLSLPVCWEAV